MSTRECTDLRLPAVMGMYFQSAWVIPICLFISVTAEEGSTITLPKPTREGYEFDYWEGSRYEAGASNHPAVYLMLMAAALIFLAAAFML